MKKVIIFLAILLPCSVWGQCKLNVTVDNIKVMEGKVRIALHGEEETFPDENPLKVLAADANGEAVSVVFEDIAPGEYAVSVYQDVNTNDILDKNAMGIPKEPFGFSNNEMGLFGPPSFEASMIVVAGDQENSITITLKHM